MVCFFTRISICLHLNVTNLRFPRPKCPKAFLKRMQKRMYNIVQPTTKATKTHIIQEFPGNPRGQKCKIPIVRSPKPALFAVEPAPQYHQLTFSKTKMPKGIAGKNAQKNVQPTQKKPKTYIIPEFPGNPRGQKCKIPIVRSPSPALFAWNLHLNVTNLHFPRPKCPKALIERMHKRMYNLQKRQSKPI